MELEENKLKSTIRKCPYCGELLPVLSNVCPSCGQIIDNQNGDGDVNSLMTEIDDLCVSYSRTTIRLYDYIFLFIPIIYIVWAFVVVRKIMKSNQLYNDFSSIKTKAQTLYGDNHRFRTYLASKTSEIEGMKGKNKTSHIIIYILLVIDVLLLCISLAN